MLDDSIEQPPRSWEPSLAAVRAACIERHDLVSRTLFRSVVEALGFDPDLVVACWFDRHQVTIVRKDGRRHHLPVEGEAT